MQDVEVELAVDGSVVTEKQVETVAKEELSVAIDEPVAIDEKEREENVEVIAMLQKELAVVDEMVKLQEKKLHVLQQMRETWLQESKEKMPEKIQDVEDFIEKRLIAETVAESRDFNAYFVEKMSIALDGDVAAMKMMKIRAGSAMELVAVAFKTGIVAFYTSSGEEVLRVDTEKKRLKSIAMDALDDQLCLVVTYETAKIIVYELKLVEKSKTDVDDKGSKRITLPGAPEYQLSVNLHRTIELSAEPSVVSIVRSSRQLVMVVAQVDGIIDFLALNGTSLRQLQTHASISAMETKRNLLAFNNGKDVIVSSMTRAQGTIFHTCPGSSAQVSSIAFDTMHPEIMYVGTHRAEILVYAVSIGASSEVSPCRLLSRSTISKFSHDSPVAIATTKSYVIAAQFQDITVFNVSKDQRNGAFLSRMCTSHLNPTTSVGNNALQNRVDFPAMVFSEGSMGSHIAFVTAGIGGQANLLLFHSLLPDNKEVSDFPWTVVIYAAIVIAAVVGSQLFIRWQRKTNVKPWDSIGKKQTSPFEKFDGFKDGEPSSHLDEDFGRYNSLSDDLREKIARAKRGSGRQPMDDGADY